MLPYRLIILLCGSPNALGLDLWGVINEQGLKLEGLWKQKVADVVSSNRDVVQSDRLSALHSQLHCLKVSVHGDVHTYKV